MGRNATMYSLIVHFSQTTNSSFYFSIYIFLVWFLLIKTFDLSRHNLSGTVNNIRTKTCCKFESTLGLNDFGNLALLPLGLRDCTCLGGCMACM